MAPPASMMALLQASKVIAFDGDALHPESFTKFLVILLASSDTRVDQLTRPKVLAYRLDYSSIESHPEQQELETVAQVSRQTLLDCWDGTLATVRESGHMMLHRGDEPPHSFLSCEENNVPRQQPLSPQEVTVFVKTLTPSCHPTERSPYLELGLQGLLNSGSKRVLAVGGGIVLWAECELYRSCLPWLRWFVWPVTRPAAGGGSEEELCCFCQSQGTPDSEDEVISFLC